MITDSSRLIDLFLPFFVLGLFALAAFLRVRKSWRFLQRSNISNGERLLNKFYILSAIVLLIATFIVFIVFIVSII
jgi:hypothetical protein